MINEITRELVARLPKPDVRAWGSASIGALRDARWLPIVRSKSERVLALLIRQSRLVVFLGIAGLVVFEMRTSSLQAIVLSALARHVTYRPDPGPSESIIFPRSGPADERHGYTRLPQITQKLQDRGYRVAAQARFSPVLRTLARWGVPPPFDERDGVGLVVRDRSGAVAYAAEHQNLMFRSYEDIPPLMVQSLLFMEDRDLGDNRESRLNPAVDWGRLAKASALYAGRKFGLPGRVEGGSTLAVQMVKYRHGDNGETRSPLDKLRQIAAASLDAYRAGPDTRAARRQIVVDYLNSMPLAAAPGFGEVHGIREGLQAWFGLDPDQVSRDLTRPEADDEKAHALKQVLALLYSVRAPSRYLAKDHDGLDRRVDQVVCRLQASGVLDSAFASAVRQAPLRFAESTAPVASGTKIERKSIDYLRTQLQRTVGAGDFYALNQLDLEAETTVDGSLQHDAGQLFERLRDPEFLAENGLVGEHLLGQGDPANVIYTLLLFESGPEGNALCAHLDNLDKPLDMNEGVKIELGSTAKLRALTHYLELVGRLHTEFSGVDDEQLKAAARAARDPITQWAAEQFLAEGRMPLDSLLAAALDRTYSANPGEVFFTGGGAHTFHNFDPLDDTRRVSVREATVRSINLVYIRLMRDIVRYHAARLPYDAAAVLNQPENPVRVRLLSEAADEEARFFLSRAYKRMRGVPADSVITMLLGSRAHSPDPLAMLFYAWNRGAGVDSLAPWLERRLGPLPEDEADRLAAAYGASHLGLSDHAFLLGRHPLEIWCAGQLAQDPLIDWKSLKSRSAIVRQISSMWLFHTRNRSAQNSRLRIRIERDAFVHMTADWKRLGFPFGSLVPSYATAIGNSSDKPAALAELMGIILNDGQRRPAVALRSLRFGSGTPYETVFAPPPAKSEQVLEPEVARALRGVLADVVARGTAQRVHGAMVAADGTPIVIAGKTGSGDNRFKTVGSGGQVLSSRAVSRTATFAFTLGDRHFGVITASVFGSRAGDYHFTSALPVTLLRLLAPAIERHLAEEPSPTAVSPLVKPANAGVPRSG